MAPASEEPQPQGAGDAPAPAPAPAPAALKQGDGEWVPPPEEPLVVPGPAPAGGSVPPEGGWGWVVMLAAMWCNGAVFGIQNSCGVLFVSMLDSFGDRDDANLIFKTGAGRRGGSRAGCSRGRARGGGGCRGMDCPLLLGERS